MSQAKQLVSLYRDIHSCDSILEKMESLLNGFQSDLGQLSVEIKTLQDQSCTMGVKLKNRLTVKQQLGQVLEGVIVPPEVIKYERVLLLLEGYL